MRKIFLIALCMTCLINGAYADESCPDLQGHFGCDKNSDPNRNIFSVKQPLNTNGIMEFVYTREDTQYGPQEIFHSPADKQWYENAFEKKRVSCVGEEIVVEIASLGNFNLPNDASGSVYKFSKFSDGRLKIVKFVYYQGAPLKEAELVCPLVF